VLDIDEARRRLITPSEARILDSLANTTSDSTMPPGPLSRFKATDGGKKKIRPSSAAANLQSHPSYTTGLFDNVHARPSTAAVTPKGSLTQRPATQAGGTRRTWKSTSVDNTNRELAKQPRRLTLGAVDGIADSDSIVRPIFTQGSVASQLKSKVGLCLCLQKLCVICMF
jgi:hypothetical protein